MTNQNEVKDLAYDLDGATGNILTRLESLQGLAKESSYLKQDMEGIDLADATAYFPDFLHKARLLIDLLLYITNDLEKDCQELDRIELELFREVVQKENACLEGGKFGDKM